MKKPDLKSLVKEIEELQVNKRKNYNNALEIIVDKYQYKDIDQLKKELYSELYILKYDLSIIIQENIANNGSTLINSYNSTIEIKEKISNLSDEQEEKEMLSINHKCILIDIVSIMLGDYSIFYTFLFTETGYTLYLYDNPSNPVDYTCSVQYIKKTSQYLIGQRKETEFLARD